ncbi:DUF3828 domain-containing protein [Xanthomonas albilineans]|nr:DUF3828 domain-containing protein [Xanthomonas albilineans]
MRLIGDFLGELCARWSLLVLLSLNCTAQANNNPSSTVCRLYRDYGWPALFQSDDEARRYLGKPIAEQSKEILSKYFDPHLTQLILNEADCNARSRGELCKLDFDPIFASQDDAAINLVVKDAGGGNVDVQYTYPSSGQKISLDFKLKNLSVGWRIYDIIYLSDENSSLRGILEGK